jgi:hypothetical protein
VSSCSFASMSHVLHRWRSQQLCDQLKLSSEILRLINAEISCAKFTYLLNRTLSLEQDSTTQELAENAPNRPNVDCGRVVSRAHQDFRCTVILRDHLLCHVLGRVGLFNARQSKVANLQHTVAVHQQIAWLDVAMEDASRVQILQTAQDLIQKHFDVIGRQVLWRHDDLVQIRLEQFCYHISLKRPRESKIKSLSHEMPFFDESAPHANDKAASRINRGTNAIPFNARDRLLNIKIPKNIRTQRDAHRSSRRFSPRFGRKIYL